MLCILFHIPLTIWIRYGFHWIAAWNPGFYGDKKARFESMISTGA